MWDNILTAGETHMTEAEMNEMAALEARSKELERWERQRLANLRVQHKNEILAPIHKAKEAAARRAADAALGRMVKAIALDLLVNTKSTPESDEYFARILRSRKPLNEVCR
jgi:hypothetical protein